MRKNRVLYRKPSNCYLSLPTDTNECVYYGFANEHFAASNVEQWIQAQVRSGEFGSASELVRAALRQLRDRQEDRALREMRRAFAQVDRHNAPGEPTEKDLATIDRVVRAVRKTNRRRK